ncbi:MAG: sigma-70 family RNA polymerase sigma factor [Ruminococcus sp.]|nr:sigma-70 family RNA polymerase sigma factor [Ruminococcus sp.]
MDEKELRERFGDVYNSTFDYIFKFLILKIDKRDAAEDIIQAVYLDLYRKMREGERILSPKHYLLVMAKHRVADYYKRKRDNESLDDAGTEIVDEKALDALENDDGYTYGEIMKALKESDDITYRIFLLHFGRDFTIEQCAKALELSPSTVKSKMYRALKKLKKELKEGERYAFFRRS